MKKETVVSVTERVQQEKDGKEFIGFLYEAEEGFRDTVVKRFFQQKAKELSSFQTKVSTLFHA